MMKNWLTLILILMSLNLCACSKKELKGSGTIEFDDVTQNYKHTGGFPGLGVEEHVTALKGYLYNNTTTLIKVWLPTGRNNHIKIKPYEQITLPKIETVGNTFGISFQKPRGPRHHAIMRYYFYPGIGDYGIIIKKDITGVTDLDVDVVTKKELDELKAKHAKELQEKVGEKVYEVGVKPKPVANIAAEYVGTDVELPEE